MRRIALLCIIPLIMAGCGGSTAPGAASGGDVHVQLSLISPSPLRTGYIPSRIELSSEQPEGWTGVPELADPKFGVLQYGPEEPGNTFGVIVDEPSGGQMKLYLDADGDGDFSNDTVPQLEESRDVMFTSADVMVTAAAGSEPVAHSLNFYRFIITPEMEERRRQRVENLLFYYRNYHLEGTVAIGGKDYKIAVVDLDNDGRYLFDDEHHTEMYVDRNADGELIIASGSAEQIGSGEIFEMDGTSYTVAGFENGALTLTVSETPAPPKPYLQPGYPALDLSFTDLKTGEEVSLADYRGKIVMIDFWATWCGPCIAELPNVKEVYDSYSRDKFDVIGISLDGPGDLERATEEQIAELLEKHGVETREALMEALRNENREQVISFCAENGMPWPEFYDGQGWQNAIAQQWRIHGIPATFLIGPDGMIVARNARGEELKEKVAELVETLE